MEPAFLAGSSWTVVSAMWLQLGVPGVHSFSFSEGVSLYVDCADQDEVDEYVDKLLKAGAKPTACGWIEDPFGLSWQIVPRRFNEPNSLIGTPAR